MAQMNATIENQGLRGSRNRARMMTGTAVNASAGAVTRLSRSA
jgi:hypothetical protein